MTNAQGRDKNLVGTNVNPWVVGPEWWHGGC